MKFIKLTIIFSLLVASSFIMGCASTPIMFGGNCPQFVNNNDVDFDVENMITAQSSGFQLFYIIPFNINGRFEDAYNDLLRQAGSGYLTDVKINESWTYAFVGTVWTTQLSAMVHPRIKAANKIIKTDLPPSSNSEIQSGNSDLSKYSQKLRELQKLKDEGLVTDKEYEQKRKSIIDGM
ncbi:MAG: hypothetical protein ACLQBQ_00860 [Smithella sp.]